MAAKEHRHIHDAKQTKKIAPFITRKTSCGQQVSELFFGVNIFDLDFWVQVDSVKQPIQRDTVDHRHVSHHWASSFDDNLDHCLVVFNNVQPRFTLWEEVAFVVTWSRSDNCSTFWLPFPNLKLDMRKQFPADSLIPLLFPEASWVDDFLLFDECNTSITTSHKSRAGIPSIRKPASKEIISDSMELWNTDVCFLHIQLMGTNVDLQRYIGFHQMLIFESSRSPATSESWNKTQPTMLSCDYTHENIACSHLRYECKKSNEPSVCHKLLSMLWLLEQVCFPAKECQVYQFVPHTNVSRQFVQSLRKVSPNLVAFQLLLQKFVIRHFSILIDNICVRFTFKLSASQNIHGREMMLVLRDPRDSQISSTLEPYSSFCPDIFDVIHVYRQEQSVFSDEQTDIPNSVLFPTPVPREPPQVVFPTGGQQP